MWKQTKAAPKIPGSITWDSLCNHFDDKMQMFGLQNKRKVYESKLSFIANWSFYYCFYGIFFYLLCKSWNDVLLPKAFQIKHVFCTFCLGFPKLWGKAVSQSMTETEE